MRDAGRQNPRLAGAGAGEHEHRPVDRLDGLALLGIEPVEIARRPGPRAGGDAVRPQSRRLERAA